MSASREIAAAPDVIFELIADPAQQPRWDGNDNLAEAAAGQRVHAVGDVFAMTLGNGAARAPVALGDRADRRGQIDGDPHL